MIFILKNSVEKKKDIYKSVMKIINKKLEMVYQIIHYQKSKVDASPKNPVSFLNKHDPLQQHAWQ